MVENQTNTPPFNGAVLGQIERLQVVFKRLIVLAMFDMRQEKS